MSQAVSYHEVLRRRKENSPQSLKRREDFWDETNYDIAPVKSRNLPHYLEKVKTMRFGCSLKLTFHLGVDGNCM